MSVSSERIDDSSIDELKLLVGRDPLTAVVQRALTSHCGVLPDARIIVGFSGGADSTALLVLLQALLERRESQLSHIVAVHVDHCIRSESAQEALHALEVCSRLGIDVDIRKVDLSETTGNLSEQARIARYRSLSAAAHEHECGYIATAHHAEDRFETMLLSLCRGCGVSGLSHPRWTRPLEKKRLIRPLLACSQVDLRALCNRISLGVTEDPTNLDPSTARGMLRQQILPLLEKQWPGAAIRASSAADRLFAASSALEQVISDRFDSADPDRWTRAGFREADHEVVVAVLRRAIVSKAAELSSTAEENSFSVRLSDAAFAVCDQSRHRRIFKFAQGRTLLVVDADHVRISPAD